MEKALSWDVSGSGLKATQENFLIQLMFQAGQGRDKVFAALVPS